MSGACLLDRRGNRSFGGCHYIAHVCIRNLYGFLFREIHSVENVEIGGIDLHGRQMPVVGIVGGEKQTVRPEGAQNFLRCRRRGHSRAGSRTYPRSTQRPAALPTGLRPCAQRSAAGRDSVPEFFQCALQRRHPLRNWDRNGWRRECSAAAPARKWGRYTRHPARTSYYWGGS